MKKINILISIALCLVMSGPLAAKTLSDGKQAEIPKGPKIRVLLVKEAPMALLEVKGAYKVIRKDLGEVLSSGSSGKRFVVHALEEGLRWGEEFPQMNQFTVLPYPETSIYVNGIQYQGAVTVYHTADNKIAIVNDVYLEDFVKSTLAVKCGSEHSKVAKEAMAIVERTQAFAHLGSKKPWDVVAEDVRYYGYGVTQQDSKSEAEVDATRFMVLEARDGVLKKSNVTATQMQDLALKGYDTQKVLKTAFPQTKIGITINPDEVAVR